jgi:PAS domain S-box-containing protein
MAGHDFDSATILDALAGGGVAVVGADGKVECWNAWLTAASGKRASEVVGSTFAQVFPGTSVAMLDSAVTTACESGASTLLTNALHSTLLPLKTLAGRALLHDVTVSPLGTPPFRGCLVQIADITNTVRRERFLRDRQNARYDALLDGVPDAIINVDSEGVVQHANPAAEQHLGYAASELAGTHASRLFDSAEVWSELWNSVRATRSLAPVEVIVRRRDGSLRYFEVSAASWLDGRETLTTAILRDVNDRHETEIALRNSEQASRANARELAELNNALNENSMALRVAAQRKDAFLATLAHELRNPLAPLRNGLQLLKLAKDDPALIERTRNMMEQQLGQMVRLIDDLLDVSRINNDMIELAQELMPVDKPIRQAVETSAPLLDAQQHDLTIDIPADTILLKGDVTRLTQVFANLLNNAAKYTPRGGNVRIAAARDGDWVTVRIADDGIGIPAHLLTQVFDMFMRVDDSLERAQSGLGVGLSLVKRLVEMHGGTVEVRSDGPGTGSEFTVRLPAEPAATGDESSRVTCGEGDAAGRSLRSGFRVLVVDDNKDSASSLAAILSMTGYEARTANDGLEALEIAAEFRPQAALLDIGPIAWHGREWSIGIQLPPLAAAVFKRHPA